MNKLRAVTLKSKRLHIRQADSYEWTWFRSRWPERSTNLSKHQGHSLSGLSKCCYFPPPDKEAQQMAHKWTNQRDAGTTPQDGPRSNSNLPCRLTGTAEGRPPPDGWTRRTASRPPGPSGRWGSRSQDGNRADFACTLLPPKPTNPAGGAPARPAQPATDKAKPRPTG